jgi:3-oxoacyl-[acyl-carrier-protein] synthase-3
MKYTKVYIDAITYELPPQVVTTAELEDKLEPLYQKLFIPKGQVENLTGIKERRWWHEGFKLADGAITAAGKALDKTSVSAKDIEAVVYGGVYHEIFEPATACRVAAELGVSPNATVHDINNACLGMVDGMVDVANRIELGQIRAGLVVASETAREPVTESIEQMLENGTMEFFTKTIAAITAGSGSAAVLLTDGSFELSHGRHKLLGGAIQSAPEHHNLCRWGHERLGSRRIKEFSCTDAVGIMKNGVDLGKRTFSCFLKEVGWELDDVDKIIAHQVAKPNRVSALEAGGLPEEKEFPTFHYLGNMGSVSLPATAAIAEEEGFLQPGDQVSFFGIGSGLVCMMLGLNW